MKKESKKIRVERWEWQIKKIVERYNSLKKACDSFLDVGALIPDSPLYEEIWRMFVYLIGCIDREDWINWFIFENDCGRKQLEASSSQARQPRKIRTPKDLARLMVEAEDTRK